MRLPEPVISSHWTRADGHFLAAGALVLLFTAQRLTGYMTLYLYQRLPYDQLVLLAHFLGGAGLVAVCTMGVHGTPMRLSSVPFVRVLVSGGWLVGSMLVLALWWMCVPALRPQTPVAQISAVAVTLILMVGLFRRVDQIVSQARWASHWKLMLPVLLWQAYSLDWELRLNFLKDELTLERRQVQWNHVAVDLGATALGIAWSLWVQRRAVETRRSPIKSD